MLPIHFRQQTEKTSNKNTTISSNFCWGNDWIPLVFFCVKSCCFKHRELRQSEKFTGKDLPCSNDLRRNITLWIWTSMPRNLGPKTMGFLKMGHDLPGELLEKIQENNYCWKLQDFFGWKISTWSFMQIACLTWMMFNYLWSGCVFSKLPRRISLRRVRRVCLEDVAPGQLCCAK